MASSPYDASAAKGRAMTKNRLFDETVAKVVARPKIQIYDASSAKAAARAKISPYVGSVEIQPEGVDYDTSAVKILQPPDNPKMNQPGHSLTMRAWLFGRKIRCQFGQTPKNLAMPVRPFLRPEKSA